MTAPKYPLAVRLGACALSLCVLTAMCGIMHVTMCMAEPGVWDLRMLVATLAFFGEMLLGMGLVVDIVRRAFEEEYISTSSAGTAVMAFPLVMSSEPVQPVWNATVDQRPGSTKGATPKVMKPEPKAVMDLEATLPPDPAATTVYVPTNKDGKDS